MPHAASSRALCALLVLIPISESADARQIEVTGRLYLAAHPTGGVNDSCRRFFDADGDGGKDFAYGGDDSNQSYLAIFCDQGNGAYPLVHEQSWYWINMLSAITAGDFDGDGDREIVYTVLGGLAQILSLGANGRYTESAQFPIEWVYTGLETGDLDGDGDVDILGLRPDGSLRVHVNVNGTFPGAPIVSPVGMPARHLALGDMDGDGDLDAVVASVAPGGEVTVLLNSGSATFTPVFVSPSTAPSSAIVLADFDQDGWPDIATVNPTIASVRVFVNQGGGAFAASVPSPTGSAHDTIDAGDFDGDGEPDLVVAGGTNGVAALVHAGSGSFAPAVQYGSGTIRQAAVTDLDGDGDRDLVMQNREALRNRGDGTFAPDPFDPLPGIFGSSLAAGDLDGDGDEDLVIRASNAMAVRVNLGDGTLGPPVPLPAGPVLLGVQLADVDVDADLDIVLTNVPTGVLVLVNQGGNFGSPIEIGPAAGASPVALGDLDLDGRPDLVTKVGSNFLVARNTGGATWMPFAGIAVPSTPYAGWALGDVDGDGDTDLVSSQSFGLRVHSNLGALVFAPPVVIAPSGPLNSILATDLDGDGDVDLVASSVTETHVLRNQGGGTFTSPVLLGVPTERLAAEDLDHDGDLDVLGTTRYAQVDLYENLGAATFAPNRPAGLGVSTTVATIDLDRDGDEDLLTTGLEQLYVLENRGRTGTAFCAGDGASTGCPCGNSSPIGAGLGCMNSTGRAGSLRASGSSSLRTDSLVLRGTGMTISSALYFQGTTAVSSGSGAVFGDGLRCVAGSVVRLGVVTNAAGQSTFPAATQPPLRVLGQVTVPGTRMYQVWYRDSAAFCTPATWDLTNGLRVTWGP